jgi:hypothetical protein
MKNRDNRWSVRHAAAAALAATLLLAAGAGCKSLGLPDNRLMSCQTNDDCKKADPKKPSCANLRCVECAYDTDCESGVCDGNQCKKLFTAAGDTGPEGPPQNLDACLSRCQDQACTDKCNEQFRPVQDVDPTKKKP